MDSGKLYIYTNPVRLNIPVSPVTVIAPHINASPSITTTAKAKVDLSKPVTEAAPAVNVSPEKVNPVTTNSVPTTVSNAGVVTSPAIKVSPSVYVYSVSVVAHVKPSSIIKINIII